MLEAIQQHLFPGSLFGMTFLLTWWVGRRCLREEDQRITNRLRPAAGAASEGPSFHPVLWLAELGRMAAAPFMPADAHRQSALRRLLGQAGYHSPAALRTVIGFKVLLLAAGVASGYLAGLMVSKAMLGISVGGLIGYLTPTVWLRRQIRFHQTELTRGLPDALDLLVVCVEAGLTIDAAMQRVSLELALAHPRLARELDMTHLETRVGLPRAEALRNLGRRTGNAALQTLASMLVQAERFGTSIAQSLRIQAESLRIARQHAAEEQAAKAAVKLTFPVVLFIFPAVLIVLAGPAIIGLMRSALFQE